MPSPKPDAAPVTIATFPASLTPNLPARTAALRSCVVQYHGFQSRETVERFEALLAAVSGMLDAPEWQLDAATGTVAVHEHLAAPDRARHAQLPATIRGPHTGDQSKIGPVCKSYRVGFVGERHGGKHGAEDLLASEAARRRHVAQKARRYVIPARRHIGNDGALGNGRNGLALRFVEKSADAIELRSTNERAAIEVSKRRPYLERSETFAKPR